jgi:protein TonB
VAKLEGGGGGGGAQEMVEAIKGQLPTIVQLQTMAPQVIRIDQPKLAMEPTTHLDMPETENLSAPGVMHSEQVSLASQGRAAVRGLARDLAAASTSATVAERGQAAAEVTAAV